jgi:hypothetical protein
LLSFIIGRQLRRVVTNAYVFYKRAHRACVCAIVAAAAAAAAANASAESVNKIGWLPLGRRLLHCKQQLILMLWEE